MIIINIIISSLIYHSIFIVIYSVKSISRAFQKSITNITCFPVIRHSFTITIIRICYIQFGIIRSIIISTIINTTNTGITIKSKVSRIVVII